MKSRRCFPLVQFGMMDGAANEDEGEEEGGEEDEDEDDTIGTSAFSIHWRVYPFPIT